MTGAERIRLYTPTIDRIAVEACGAAIAPARTRTRSNPARAAIAASSRALQRRIR